MINNVKMRRIILIILLLCSYGSIPVCGSEIGDPPIDPVNNYERSDMSPSGHEILGAGTVCPSGCDYTGIQEALAGSDPGETKVYPGRYEGSLMIRKAIRITDRDPVNRSRLPGEGREDPGVMDIPHKKLISAYVFLFDSDYDHLLSVNGTIPWKKIDRLNIAFATVRDGELTNLVRNGSEEEADSKIRTIVDLCHQENPDTEIFIVSNYGDGMDDEYKIASEDPERFGRSVLTYLNRYHLDGYDMDWESPEINEYSAHLISLLTATYGILKDSGNNPHNTDYKVTHAVWPGVHSPELVSDLNDSVDQINIMSYGGNNLTSYADEYNQAGFPYEKMIGGAESEFGYEGGPDTSSTVSEKVRYIREKDLAGIMEWRLDNDMRTKDNMTEDGPPTFQVLDLIYNEIRKNPE